MGLLTWAAPTAPAGRRRPTTPGSPAPALVGAARPVVRRPARACLLAPRSVPCAISTLNRVAFSLNHYNLSSPAMP